MKRQTILIVGGGIGGLTAGIALGRAGHAVTIIEKSLDWAVYGVGIIQQANVVRAMADLGLLDDYLAAGFGFDEVEVFVPSGERVAKLGTPRLVEGLPANVGIGRRALHDVLIRHALEAGAAIRLGTTVAGFDETGERVSARLSDGSTAAFDLVIGADGLYSRTRSQIFPDAPVPEFTGQAVWRYNLPRPADMTALRSYEGPIGVGLVPLASNLMYMFATTAEPGNPRRATEGLAAAMRGRLAHAAPAIAELAADIADDDGVVYKPLEWVFLEGPWHRDRVVLLGDAVHATTPHLGQGAGMAIEDAIVLTDEIDRHPTLEAAFDAYRARRFDRCKYIVEASLALCRGQLGIGPRGDHVRATAEMFAVVAQPI